MKNKGLLFLLIPMLFLNSCQDYSKPITINNENFSIVLPGFVKEDELAEDAELEYANRFRNFYVVAFILKDTVGQDSLWKMNTQRISKGLLNPKVDSTHRENFIESKITGNFKDEKEAIFYRQKLIYKKGESLLLTIWTRGQERNKKYEGEMNDILNSFKPAK
jgi:hypothetical protein